MSTQNYTDIVDGLWWQNPALVQLLGLCPLLAVSNTAINGLGLGTATLLTLTLSSLCISALRRWLLPAIRIPVFVLVIATLVTIIDLLLLAWLPLLHTTLGIFLPLIVSNCLIIARAEVYASRHSCLASLRNAFAMGLGFLWVLLLLGAARELLGQGTLFNQAELLLGPMAANWSMTLFEPNQGLLIAVLPPGAFIVLGLMVAIKNAIDQRLPPTGTTPATRTVNTSNTTTDSI